MHREKDRVMQNRRFVSRTLDGARPGKNITALRILLVDDEPFVRQSMALFLGADGHTVTESESGAGALQQLARSSFDVVITDYRMQGMNGDELARRIKDRYPEMPVYMLTGFYDQPIGPENPVLAVYHKPDQIKDLREAIMRADTN